jgi:tRNA(adenine34) deaminase
MTQHDYFWMEQAIELAQRAAAEGEVPVGAVLVIGDAQKGAGYNRSISLCDPTAHAEILALREAAIGMENYRLLDSTLYVTLEPCPMCAGAMVHGRVKRVVFGASDPRTGACGSVYNLVQSDYLNHQVEITAGILSETCGELLRKFFRERRSSTMSQ